MQETEQNSGKNNEMSVRIILRDPAVQAFYRGLPDRSKSRKIEEIIARGLAIYGDELFYLDGTVTELVATVDDLITQIRFGQTCLIEHREDLDELAANIRDVDTRVYGIEQTTSTANNNLAGVNEHLNTN
jgi:hypothetical protein